MNWNRNGATVLENDNEYAEAYLDWVNNFLTVSRFADHYGWSEEQAIYVIEEGKRQHLSRINPE